MCRTVTSSSGTAISKVDAVGSLARSVARVQQLDRDVMKYSHAMFAYAVSIAHYIIYVLSSYQVYTPLDILSVV